MSDENEQELQPNQEQRPTEKSTDQDALRRINEWLDRLEDQARRLLETFQPEELEPAQAAAVAGKYITLIARLLELRQQFSTEASGEEERLLRIIFGNRTMES